MNVIKHLSTLALLSLSVMSSHAYKDQMTFAVMGNSISTYESYLPSGYAVYYATSRGFTKGVQVGDTWWMQLSRLSGMSFLTNSSWSGSRVATDPSKSAISAFTSDDRVNSVGRAGVPDAIVIAGGTNDWSGGVVPLGEYSTTVFNDSLTFRGAYTMLLHKLKQRYPDIIPICCSIFPRSQATDAVNKAGWTQQEANASIEHIAKQFGGYYIDCTGVPFSSDWTKYTIDKLHPTAEGHRLLAECMAKSLLEQGVISEITKTSTEVSTADKLLDLTFDKNGIVNKGTFQTTVGKCGDATTIYDKVNDTYYGCTKLANTDYFYALYDKDDKLGTAMNNSATWETLVRLENVSEASGNGNIVKFLTSQENGGWCFYNTPSNVTFNYLTEAGVYSNMKYEINDSILVSGKFFHLVVTLDRPSHIMRYFVNGRLVATGTRVATDLRYPNCGSVAREKDMWIGLGADPGPGAVGGTGQNGAATTFVFTRIYDGALTQDAAKALYNDEVKKFTEPSTDFYDKLIMNAVFTADGVENKVPDTTTPIEKQGDIVMAYNTDLNSYEACFNGNNSQFFKYNMGNNPAVMNQIADAYSIEILCKTESAKPSASIRPISFVDGFGGALHMNGKGNIAYGTITYGYTQDNTLKKTTWSWTGEGTLQEGYNHYLLVYDRKNGFSKLYINGQEKISRDLYFKECNYFEWAPSEWLAIGGTPKSPYETATTTGSYPFKGNISLVRLWGRSFDATEAQSLSAMALNNASVTLNNGGFAAICLPFEYKVPEGTIAYIVSEETTSNITLKPVGLPGDVIPYGAPIILGGTAQAVFNINPADKRTTYSPVSIEGNKLKGTFGGTTIPKNSYYLGANGKSMLKASSDHEVSSFRAWLPASNATKVMRSFVVLQPDAIQKVTTQRNNTEAIYDLDGVQVNNPMRGIYIKNNKKILIK